MKVLFTCNLPPPLFSIEEVRKEFEGVEIKVFDKDVDKSAEEEQIRFFELVKSFKPDGIFNLFPVWFNLKDEFFKDYCCENLKIICTSSTGFNLIDAEEAKRRNIYVTNSQPERHANNTAEIAMFLVIACLRQTHKWMYCAMNPETNQEYMKIKSLFGDMGKSLQDSVLGIVGLGKIGQCLARMARYGFQMKVMYTKRNRLSVEEERELGVEYATFEEILTRSDVVSVNCPLNEHTKHMFGKEQFEKMKSTSYIVNTARGAIIHEKELLEAVENKVIAGAGLDVFDHIPVSLEKIGRFKELGICFTPYLGGWERAGATQLLRICLDNLKAVLVDGVKPPNSVNI